MIVWYGEPPPGSTCSRGLEVVDVFLLSVAILVAEDCLICQVVDTNPHARVEEEPARCEWSGVSVAFGVQLI